LAILTLNIGSSSVKVGVFARDLKRQATLDLSGLASTPHLRLMREGQRVMDHALTQAEGEGIFPLIVDLLAGQGFTSFDVIGHRVVHGGPDLTRPLPVDADVMVRLGKLVSLAPLHQPFNLEGIRKAQAAFPGVMQVACFDTAFHRNHPPLADLFALPRALHEEGVRRYGFHGISYESVSGQLAARFPDLAAGRVIIAHLGSGASMCALAGGRSMASTMGFSALDGLPMGTRPGQLDPGIVLWLMQEKGMDAQAISDLLYRQSGLKGLSGISADMRVLLASNHPHAREAISYFIARARREIGGLTAELGGLDALVFCGGIGENAPAIRAMICEGLGFLGVTLDMDRNASHGPLIAAPHSRVAVLVVPTDEEATIAAHAARCLDAA
jgi:acetate kinase